MPASDFRPPERRPFKPWQRYLSYLPLYLLVVPLSRVLEVSGVWKKLVRRRGAMFGAFGDYRARAGDVFACAGFKSGTTWLLQMATQIAHRGNAEFADIHQVVPWPDGPPMLKAHMVPIDDPSPLARSPTGRRVIKTHLPFEAVPYTEHALYIGLVRDPKDACVSGYHFMRSMVFGPAMPSVATWVEMFVQPSFAPVSWAAHLQSYWRVRDRPNVLFLTYEEMKRDSAAAILRIAAFMGVELAAAELAEVERRSSFAYMKQEQQRFNPGHVVPWGSASGYMIRRGERGASDELLTPGQRRRIDDTCRAQLVALGSDFPYDATFAAR
ncbi:MAG TPA: sulfotransferase domain-containing protein [Gammaproteobacteria bacterium]|nr:sulfotransferase domain-containing protein [Gammaproteobacteria bacterium]